MVYFWRSGLVLDSTSILRWSSLPLLPRQLFYWFDFELSASSSLSTLLLIWFWALCLFFLVNSSTDLILSSLPLLSCQLFYWFDFELSASSSSSTLLLIWFWDESTRSQWAKIRNYIPALINYWPTCWLTYQLTKVQLQSRNLVWPCGQDKDPYF